MGQSQPQIERGSGDSHHQRRQPGQGGPAAGDGRETGDQQDQIENLLNFFVGDNSNNWTLAFY